MKEIRVKFTGQIKRTDSVISFRFSTPEKVDFVPGQFLQVIFDEIVRGNKELNKYLSLSCSPTKEYIEVTKRISGSLFSQRLLALKSGDEVLVKIPMGNCTFQGEAKKIGFLIGGIGITPVISIIEYIVEKGLDTDVSLFYSNRTEDDIAFKSELDRWQAIHKNIKVYYTITECQPKDNVCLYGYINKEMLENKMPDMCERVLYVYGPPRMVEATSKLACELSNRRENIRIENFIGY